MGEGTGGSDDDCLTPTQRVGDEARLKKKKALYQCRLFEWMVLIS
jgi:hypothetical protein